MLRAKPEASPTVGDEGGTMKTVKKRCAEKKCRGEATTAHFCRFHYIAHWGEGPERHAPMREDRLNYYIREITRRYPEEYLEIIKRDLSSDESFKKSLRAMNIEFNEDEIASEFERQEILKKVKSR